MLIDATALHKIVKALLIEDFTYAELARRLHLKCERFRLHTDQVTIGRYRRVRRLYQRLMLEGSD